MVIDSIDDFNGLLRLTEEEFERGKVVYPDIRGHTEGITTGPPMDIALKKYEFYSKICEDNI